MGDVEVMEEVVEEVRRILGGLKGAVDKGAVDKGARMGKDDDGEREGGEKETEKERGVVEKSWAEKVEERAAALGGWLEEEWQGL